MSNITRHTIPVNRTARYYTLGNASSEASEVWFVLHGYGQLANYFIKHFAAIDDGSRLIVAPEALSRFYVGRNPERIGASWMTKVEREQEIADYLAYLNQVATHILDLVGRATPITVFGFSQGATTASRWVTLGRLPAKQLILWAGPIAHDLDMDQYAPILSAMNPKFVVGDKDFFITPEKLEEEKERMTAQGISFTFVPFEGEHRMDAAVLKEIA